MGTNKFWMISSDRPNPMGSKVKHASYETAEKEAERLARLTPGVTFFILESIIGVKKLVAIQPERGGRITPVREI